MTALRSLLFNLIFYGWTGCLCVLALPALLLPRDVLVFGGRIWARGTVVLLRFLVGLRHQVRGIENNPRGSAIYALKHQSAWDTLLLPVLFRDPMIVLKRELIFIPLFGWYLVKTKQIAVDRSGRAAALKRMINAAKAGAGAGRPIVIFPEGTRVPPGESRPYHPGVAALYGLLDLPVVPVALNSGFFWGRRRFLKKAGVITVEFLPAISPGLERKAFLAELNGRIEGACKRLADDARQAN
ncbi:MAG TPA: lysophospholipid acyltransferase family protein [Alphaproteobacteria bacterium]|nr:lysophospholipid acyltransferase family protein [Alphaproteobacteria bacterium]